MSSIASAIGTMARRALVVSGIVAATAGAQPRVFNFDVASADAATLRDALRTGTPIGDLRFDPASGWLLATGDFGPVYTGQLNCHSAPFCGTPNGQGPNGTSFGQFSFLTPQPFLGAWISGPTTLGLPPGVGGAPNRVFWELLNGGTVVYTSPVLAVAPTPTFLGVAYTGPVESVRLAGNAGATVVDDITYGAAAAVVPEPATWASFGTGLLLIGGAAARRRGRRTD